MSVGSISILSSGGSSNKGMWTPGTGNKVTWSAMIGGAPGGT
jgi:hypothetical protein